MLFFCWFFQALLLVKSSVYVFPLIFFYVTFAVVSTFSDNGCQQAQGSLSLVLNNDCMFLSQVRSQQVFATLTSQSLSNGTQRFMYSNFVVGLDASASTACLDMSSAANCSVGFDVCTSCYGTFIKVSLAATWRVGWVSVASLVAILLTLLI